MFEKLPSILLTRVCKAILVGACGLYFLIVVFNNLTDYGSNYHFVQHVLSMDDTFPGNLCMYRALTSPIFFNIFYGSIIAWESVCSITLLTAAWFLLQAGLMGSEARFVSAKGFATLGLTLSLLLWFVAFLTVGGEWFIMWQSHTWNGQEAAFRMFTTNALVLIFLWQVETNSNSQSKA